MKKKKRYGLFGTNKRKPARRAEQYTKDYDEEYDAAEYDNEEYDDEEYDTEYAQEEGTYYEDGNYEVEEYEESAEYYEAEAYEDDEYDEAEAYEAEEYDEAEAYEAEEYDEAEEYAYAGEEVYDADEYDEPLDYEEEAYYESEEYDGAEPYDEYSDTEYDNEEGFDTDYAGYTGSSVYEEETDYDFSQEAFTGGLSERIRNVIHNMTAMDVIVALTGVVLLAAAVITFQMVHTSKEMEEQIQAIVPIGEELSSVGIVGESGLLAMSDAQIMAQNDTEVEAEEVITSQAEEEKTVKVSVSFTSVERDLKIRFTDAATGELITGTAFEVTLTNAQGKQLILTDDDKDGIIYASSVNAGKFDAVITSTDKYKFPSTPQQVTVKDKVEYVVINVQDEVKTEAQVNAAVEDTEEKVAVTEEVKLTDTVEFVESSKTVVSGSEGYTKIDKSTIPDPSQLSLNQKRMLFDTLNVTLDKTNLKLYAGANASLQGTSYKDYEETLEGGEKREYKFTSEWKSSNESVAVVSGGTVTAKGAGTATITYTVTRKTITTKTIAGEKKEETKTEEVTISAEEYKALSDEEKAKCTENKNEAGEVTGYTYQKTTTVTTEGESKTQTSENTETFSAACEVTVENVQISSGSLELTKTADSCSVKGTLTVKPSKLVYTKNDGSTETITSDFPTIVWSSSDTSIAAVDSSTGVVTGVKQGTATITGQVNGVKDASGNEVTIKASATVTVNAAAGLAIKLDRDQVWLAVGGSTTLVPTVSNYVSDASVTWTTADAKIATVDEKGKVTGVAAGTVKVTATTKEKDTTSGKQLTASCVVTINSDATADTSTRLKDKDGRQVYIKNSDGKYIEAVYADYFTAAEFFILNDVKYAYKGWQTIDGKTYYYDKNGALVTGTQIIQGVTYNFGSDGAIQTTVNGSTFGIDVSKHNGKIDWNAVKSSGVDYVIIRCAYRGSSTGALITDPNFHTNIKGATAAGLKVGIYVFSQAVNEVEAVKEASLAVSLAQGYKLTYPIFIDTEASGGRADKIDTATRTAVVNAFCQTVKNAGYKTGIYASKAWYEQKLNMGSLGGYTIWLAQYAAAPTYSGKYHMWQYSSKGTISGINGKVDLNLSYLGY